MHATKYTVQSMSNLPEREENDRLDDDELGDGLVRPGASQYADTNVCVNVSVRVSVCPCVCVMSVAQKIQPETRAVDQDQVHNTTLLTVV
jgi:hypothetical protein